MKILLRWYESDVAVNLSYLKQVPQVVGVASELVKPVGSVWPLDELELLKSKINLEGLTFEVVESVKVHEDIKLGKPTRDLYIDNFIQTIRNLGKIGVKIVCYDFMPVFDWFRTSTTHVLEDGSTTLVYDKAIIEKLDPLKDTIAMSDWETVYSNEELKEIFKEYGKISKEDMWENLEYFLKRVIPEAEAADVKMGMHPDDPCWDIFGLPRIMSTEEDLDRFLAIVDSEYNSLTLCSGSLGCDLTNNVGCLVRKYGSKNRLAFGHIRNIKVLEDGSFYETAHFSTKGSLDVVDIVKAYLETVPNVYIRPDHGRMIWGETGAAGYGLYDRALGAMYIAGIEETLKKQI